MSCHMVDAVTHILGVVVDPGLVSHRVSGMGASPMQVLGDAEAPEGWPTKGDIR